MSIPANEGKPFIFFVKEYSASVEIKSCGGDEQTLNSAHADFKNCDFSDDNKDDCLLVFNPEFSGKMGWSIEPNMAIESWVKIQFQSDYQINTITFSPKENEKNNIKRLLVIEASGAEHRVNLIQDSSP